MLKKLSWLFAAFVLGVVISLAIQACGNESKIETGNNVTTDDVPSSGSSGVSCNCAWGSQKFRSQIIYDENGLESNRIEYEYDNIGRVISLKHVYYANISGKRFLLYKIETDYTYADSDNIRYGTTSSVSSIYISTALAVL